VSELPNQITLTVFKSWGGSEKENLENQGHGFGWLIFNSWKQEMLQTIMGYQSHTDQ